jgi:hypothetical protein
MALLNGRSNTCHHIKVNLRNTHTLPHSEPHFLLDPILFNQRIDNTRLLTMVIRDPGHQSQVKIKHPDYAKVFPILQYHKEGTFP